MKRTAIRRMSEKRKRKLGGKVYSTIQGARSALPSANAEREKKRREKYRKKLAMYRRSKTYKVVEARAGGRCENMLSGMFTMLGGTSVAIEARCLNGRPYDKMHHHHTTYARFGGQELPEDVLLVCEDCHRALEAKHPTRKHRFYRQEHE